MSKNYYAIIPASVRYDERLKPNAKLLYGEITALSNEKGYCWAKNSYFAELYGVSKFTVSKWISQLIEYEHVYVEITYKPKSKEVDERKLYIVNPVNQNNNTSCQKEQEGYSEKEQYPMDKKSKDNNTSNTTSINNTSNKKRENTLKKPFGDMQNVFLTDDEYQKLIEKHGEEKTLAMIDKLDSFIPNAKKAYKSHYATMFPKNGWVNEWYEERKMKVGGNSAANSEQSKRYSQKGEFDPGF